MVDFGCAGHGSGVQGSWITGGVSAADAAGIARTTTASTASAIGLLISVIVERLYAPASEMSRDCAGRTGAYRSHFVTLARVLLHRRWLTRRSIVEQVCFLSKRGR